MNLNKLIKPIDRRYAGDYGSTEGYIPVCRSEDEEEAEDMLEEMENDLDKAIKYEEDPVEDYNDFRPGQSWWYY